MLDTQWSIRDMPVEPGMIEWIDDGLMKADTAQPALALCGRHRQRHGERAGVVNLGRPARDRFAGGGGGLQMQMVIAQRRQQSAAVGVDHRLADLARQMWADCSDQGDGDEQIDKSTEMQFGIADQHVKTHSSGTVSVSARTERTATLPARDLGIEMTVWTGKRWNIRSTRA